MNGKIWIWRRRGNPARHKHHDRARKNSCPIDTQSTSALVYCLTTFRTRFIASLYCTRPATTTVRTLLSLLVGRASGLRLIIRPPCLADTKSLRSESRLPFHPSSLTGKKDGDCLAPSVRSPFQLYYTLVAQEDADGQKDICRFFVESNLESGDVRCSSFRTDLLFVLCLKLSMLVLLKSLGGSSFSNSCSIEL